MKGASLLEMLIVLLILLILSAIAYSVDHTILLKTERNDVTLLLSSAAVSAEIFKQTTGA